MVNNQETQVSDLLKRDGVVTSATEESVVNKPYKLRKLNSKDISPMIKIIKKIDLKRFRVVIQETNLMSILATKAEERTAKEIDEDEKIQEENSNNIIQIGGALIFEAIPILLDAIDNAIGDVNKLLAGVAGLEVEEVENMDLDVYFNLIYDFITKPEFEGFIKAVSKFVK